MRVLLPFALAAVALGSAAAQTTPSPDPADRPLSPAEVQSIFNAHQTESRATDPCVQLARDIDASVGRPLRRAALYDYYRRECLGRRPEVRPLWEDPSYSRR